MYKKSVLRVQSCWFAYRKCFIKPGGLVYFIFIWGGWVLLETGGLFERECSFNLEKTVVSVLHKELEYKVENLKYKKLDVMQPRFKNKSRLPVGEQTSCISPHEVLQLWLIYTVHHLLVKNN